MAEQTARWLVVLAVLLPQAPLNGAAASEPRQPVLNAVPMNALFSGPKVHLTARTSGGPQPQGAPGEPAVDPGAGEAVQPPQSIFDDFPADDSERLLQHSGNETATEAGREYIGDDSTGYCFNEHGKVIAAYRVIQTWNVCFVGFFVFICVATCAVRNWTGRHQQFLQGGDDNMHNNDHDDIDPARNDPRDKFDSAPFTQVNDRRARDVSPGAERSRAPIMGLNTTPANLMGPTAQSPSPCVEGFTDAADAPGSVHACSDIEPVALYHGVADVPSPDVSDDNFVNSDSDTASKSSKPRWKRIRPQSASDTDDELAEQRPLVIDLTQEDEDLPERRKQGRKKLKPSEAVGRDGPGKYGKIRQPPKSDASIKAELIDQVLSECPHTNPEQARAALSHGSCQWNVKKAVAKIKCCEWEIDPGLQTPSPLDLAKQGVDHNLLQRIRIKFDKKDLVVDKYDIGITREKIEVMSTGCSLSSEIITWWLEWWCEKTGGGSQKMMPKGMRGVGKNWFASTYFYSKLVGSGTYTFQEVKRWTQHVNVFECDKMIIPINQHMHWYCACINFVGKRIDIFDSMGPGAHPEVRAHLLHWLRDEHMDKRGLPLDEVGWTLSPPSPEIIHVPKQDNNCDCGVFAFLFSASVSLDRPFDFSQRDIPMIRNWMVQVMYKEGEKMGTCAHPGL